MSSAASSEQPGVGGLSGKALGVLSVVVVILWLTGIFQILAGVICGSLIVLALMMTIEQIPGFWAFACWGPGKIVVLAGTAWLTHAVFGSGTVLGMIALSWSLVLKVLVIDGKRRQRELGYG